MHTFAWLIEACKEYNLFIFWGEQVLITKAVDYDSPKGDIKQVIKTAKRNTSYQCSMLVMPLFSIVELDAVVKVTVGQEVNKVGSKELTLGHILL